MLARSIQPTSPPSDPPPGCWVIDDGIEVRIGVSTSSIRRATKLVAASVLVGIIVVAFFILMLNTTILHHGGTPPNWLPQWSLKPRPASPHPIERLWALFAVSLLGELVIVVSAVTALAGRLEVTLRNGHGRVFSGAGPIGITQNFDASAVRQISIKRMMNPDQVTEHPKLHEIVMEAERTVRFGSFLNPEQQAFMQRTLTDMLPVRAVRHGRDRGIRPF